MPDLGRCRSCGAMIVWGRTVNGRAMPLDALPTADGNCVLGDDGTITVTAGPVEGGRRSHHSTCPRADQHRAKR